MNELQIFSNEQFGSVRVVEQNGDPWFVGKDVADILGYTNQNEAIQDHVDEEDKLNSKTLLSRLFIYGLLKEDGIFPVMEGEA